MSHAQDITAGLLPLPQQIRSAKHESGPTARGATRVQWTNEQDPLVQAYLERLWDLGLWRDSDHSGSGGHRLAASSGHVGRL